jgi:hypothetical protein
VALDVDVSDVRLGLFVEFPGRLVVVVVKAVVAAIENELKGGAVYGLGKF